MLKKLGSLALGATIAATLVSCSTKPEFTNETQISIIPLPASVQRATGTFELNEDTVIYTKDDKDSIHCANFFSEKFAKASGMTIPVVTARPKVKKNIIVVAITDKVELGDEAYKIKVTPDAAVVIANKGRGLFWGIQSLLQLLPTEAVVSDADGVSADWTLPACQITDKPRYSYRGMHLDVGRHIFSVEDVKKYIDYLAAHKLNTFHWHLTEDQGWRIEIKKYPKLTEVGAWRKTDEGQLYGGFYTQEEVKDIVKYATDRYITVIPEIEMPGHSVAAVSAYPQLSCRGEKVPVRTAWGVSRDVYCAGNEEVFTFLEDVLTEVMALFPSEYIHIGGDECPKDRWKECPKCQKRISDENLKNEYELQSWFVRRAEKFLNSKGRKLIGWDEIMEGGLSPNATVMFWLHMGNVKKAAAAGHDVIMTPNSTFYFDHYQGDKNTEPKAIGGFTTMKDVYDYSLIPANLTEEEAKHIIGGQANCWTEYMPNFAQVEYMVLPRMSALSETLWTSKERKNYESFKLRMRAQYQRYSYLGANYRVETPKGPELINGFLDKATVSFEQPLSGKIYITGDGSEPTEGSEVYKKPFQIDESHVIKAKVITPEGAESVTVAYDYKKLDFVEPVVKEEVSQGVKYEMFKGQFPTTAEIAGDAVKAGETATLALPEGVNGDNFGLKLSAYIMIEEDGVYTFYTASDDGSVLYIGNEKVVDNDGYHSMTEKSGAIALKAGLHPIKVDFMEGMGSEKLIVSIKSDKMEKQVVKAELLFIEK